MERGHAQVRLADGEVVAIADASEVYEELWVIAAQQRGAVTTARKLLDAHTFAFRREPVPLDAPESAAFRTAMHRLDVRRARDARDQHIAATRDGHRATSFPEPGS